MRPRRKLSVTFWLLIAALIALAILPVSGVVNGPHDGLIILTALAGMLLAMLWRAWMARRLRRQEAQLAHLRYGELKKEILTLGQPVSVVGASGTGLVLGLAGVDALFVWAAVDSGGTGFMLTATAFTLLLALGLAQWLTLVGRPVLTMTREGVQPAGFGLMPWSAIQGIDLSEVRHRYGHAGHVLHLFVPDLRRRLSDAHPVARLLRSVIRTRRLSQVIAVRLQNTSESPSVIERLCRDLWKEATGRRHFWSVHLSAAEAQLALDVSNLPRSTSRPPTLQDAERELQALQELDGRIAAVSTAAHMRLAWMQFGMILGLAFLLLMIGNLLADALTSFVSSDTWLAGSLATAGILALPGYALLMRRMQAVSGGKLRDRQRIGVFVAMAASLILTVPPFWLLIQKGIGDPVARMYGVTEEVSVVATKKDTYRRRGCRLRLRGPGLGAEICLTRAEYDSLPQQLTVELRIRRGPLGYHVDTQSIVRPAASPE